MTLSKTAVVMTSGAVAGAVGTLAMDLLWYRRSLRDGGEAGFVAWEFSTGASSFDDVGAPAQVGRKAAAAVGIDLPEQQAGLTNDIVHWSTGSGWGIGGAALASATGLPAAVAGLASGVGAFAAAYTLLPLLGLYDPIWEYDADTLRKDATAHATYAVATGVALSALTRVVRARRSR